MSENRLQKWLLWEFGATLAVIIVMWPLGRWLSFRNDAFYAAIANGDLLLFAALLLIGVYAEYAALSASNSSARSSLAWISSICHLTGVVGLVAYGGIKVFLMDGGNAGHGSDCVFSVPGIHSNSTEKCDALNMISLMGMALVTTALVFGLSYHLIANSAGPKLPSTRTGGESE